MGLVSEFAVGCSCVGIWVDLCALYNSGMHIWWFLLRNVCNKIYYVFVSKSLLNSSGSVCTSFVGRVGLE